MVKMLMGPIVLLKQCEVIYVYVTYRITYTSSTLSSMEVLLWIQSQELIFKIMFTRCRFTTISYKLKKKDIQNASFIKQTIQTNVTIQTTLITLITLI